ncbi:helix-turn-helix transcriptional regulator [Photobacterium atrarenae]|uniref:Transcriptional regulator n=1 Tax=Photobacterium atrarenae TaxID=865757 RepID=A0ABY5GH11_9GAMM|nr:transcriptional regulator [Photobacterium atrarenae]UTV27882.1 transcriptional regulator [Photobacterium atrarenae]
MTKTRYFDFSREMTKGGDIQIISKKELTGLLGRSPSTVSRMIEDGRLPEPLRTPKGNISGWLSSTLTQWLKEQRG